MRRVEDGGEVDEDALGRLRPQVGLGARVLHRADVGLEHEVELARLGELSPIVFVPRPADLIGAKSLVALLALDQRVGEVLDVSRCLPDFGIHDDAGVDTDHVIAQLDHRAPPGPLDVVAQGDTEGPEVHHPLDAAVDLAGLKEEAAPLGQGDELLHHLPPPLAGEGGVGGRHQCRTLRMKSRLLSRRSR